MITVGDEHVSLTLYGQQYDFDKTAYALWQLSEAFEVKIKQDVEKLRENQKNGKVLKATYEGYTPDGQQKTAYKVLPWLWDNIEEVARMMQNIGPFVSRHFKQYGITLNPNWKAISAPFVAKTEKITEILGQAQSDAFTKTASQLANDYQRAYNQELSRDYGLSFGIISNSFTAHLVYAAQATAKEMKDKERAAEFASSVTGNPMEHLLLATFHAIYPLYIEKAEPALFQILSEYYSYVVSLIAKELGYDFEQVSKSFDIEKSINVLNTSPVSKDAIFKALSKNPSDGGVIGYAIVNDLIDDELTEYAYSTTPLFLTRVKNWATNKLLEIYNEGKLFNRPLVNDDNRKIIMGLMAFYKKKNRSLFDCQDWQDILAGAFFPVVGKHLTDFTELAITVASPLDFDAKARAGKQFHFSNEIKQTFVFLHNELYFSGAKTTASFLDLKSPVSISAFDAKVKEINERLVARGNELATEDEEKRKVKEREDNVKSRNVAFVQFGLGLLCLAAGIGLFFAESFFLGLVEIGIAIAAFIFGGKRISAWVAYSSVADKEMRENKARAKREFLSTNKKKITVTIISIASFILSIVLFVTVCMPIIHYSNAEKAYNEENYGKAAILYAKASWYKDADKMCDTAWSHVANKNYIDANATSIAAIKNNGTVVAAGINEEGDCSLSGWTNIVSIAKGWGHTIGLKADGTVVAKGDNDDGECNVGGWRDIVAISTAEDYTLGLRKDGTVVATGSNEHEQCEISGWKDIVSIVAGVYHAVGLKSDGTVVATSISRGSHAHTPDYGQSNVGNWKDIVYIDASEYQTVGVKKDGTVVSTKIDTSVWSVWQPYYYGQDQISSWKNIVKVCVDRYHVIGLKKDGTLVSTSIPSDNYKNDGQCNVSGITNVVDITVGPDFTAAIKSDGSAILIGLEGGFSDFYEVKPWNSYEWKNLKLLNSSN